VEGDAILIQRMYQATTMSDPAELERLENEQAQAAAAADFDRLPYVVAQTMYFPYWWGPQFIHGAVGSGPLTTFGEYGPAVDRLFRRPPVSTSQILHPERYIARIEPVPVPLRDLAPLLGSDWVPLGEGPVGELSHRLLLEQWLRETDPELAIRASSPWTGDRTSVYRRGDGSPDAVRDLIVVLKTRWETAEDAAQWGGAYAATVPLLYQRLAGVSEDPGEPFVAYPAGAGRLAWERPFERSIGLGWSGQFSAIAIAPEVRLAQQLVDFALAGD
ncbi:MAG: hypothetical protein ACREKH_02020, partial [Candidatus Rokuibacteriota bacterium]